VSGANISVALRQIYSRYLLPYEKAFSSNFGNDLLDDDEDERFDFKTIYYHLFDTQLTNYFAVIFRFQIIITIITIRLHHTHIHLISQ
jgi:hypothetical protein